MHDFRYVGGELFCEGVSVASLVKKFGTPLYIYSQKTLTDHFQKLDQALAPLDHLVCFAMKSNSNLAVLRVLAELGSGFDIVRSEEHTSELQSLRHLVCRLLLEKKNDHERARRRKIAIDRARDVS